MYPKLGVNIDHVATIRNSRGTTYPDPLYAAVLAELGGADQITIHLREDRRHIIDRDLQLLRQTVKTRLNLEMAVTDEMIAIAKKNRPDMTTLVPEKREEKTTEGGLDLKKDSDKTIKTINELKEADITVSLFIDPDLDQVHLAREFGAHAIEIHTGTYANEVTPEGLNREFDKIKERINENENINTKNNKTETINTKSFFNEQLFVITDPPRSGMHPKTILQLKELQPKVIIYISCNINQLKKDLPKFKDYKIKSAALFDLFPQTLHSEGVVELVKE